MGKVDLNKLAGIQYSGEAGITQTCIDAVTCLIQAGIPIRSVRIISAHQDHCLLLSIGNGDLIAIKSGFGSGYVGEGSRGFSYILALLDAYRIEIDEVEVASDVIEKIDASALASKDLQTLQGSRPVRPARWYSYIFDIHDDLKEEGRLWEMFEPVIPFAIVDRRLVDIAIGFWTNSDERLLTAFRRLEDIVRKRTSSTEHGAKLFNQAFKPDGGPLGWPRIDPAEQAGRMHLFVGTYMAHRNPRAHREPDHNQHAALTEFLLINHLFCLEAEAVERETPAKGPAVPTA